MHGMCVACTEERRGREGGGGEGERERERGEASERDDCVYIRTVNISN